jgi:hypothetical protein
MIKIAHVSDFNGDTLQEGSDFAGYERANRERTCYLARSRAVHELLAPRTSRHLSEHVARY